MANKRIKDISTTATSAASDDFVVIDGAANGTRKIDARPLGGVFDENVVVENGGNKTTYASNFLRSENGSYYIDAYNVGGDIVFRTSVASALDTQSMIIDGATGNVAIGTTSASHPLTVTGNSYLIGASSSIIGNNDATNYALSDSSGVLQNKWYGGHEWYTLGSNLRMKLDSSGNLDVASGVTTLSNTGDNALRVESTNGNPMTVNVVGSAPNYLFDVRDDGTSVFRVDGAGNVTAYGQFNSSSSNASGPAFAVSSGNGIYNSGANQIGFSTNSTKRWTINSSGSLVAGASETPIEWNGNGIVSASSHLYIRSTSGGNLYFQTGGAQRWEINSSGNLIGNSGGQILYGDGDVLFPGASANLSWDKSADTLTLQAGAKVGIGGSPSAPLSVVNSTTPRITMGYGGSYGEHRLAWDSSKLVISADDGDAAASSEIGFRVDGSTKATIDSSGNLAIGRATAGARIDLATATDTAGIFVRDSSDSSITHQIYNASGHGNIAIYADGGVNTVNINSAGDTFFNGGRIGIGTSSPGSYNSNANNLVVGSGSGNEGMSIASGASSEGGIYFANGTTGTDQYNGALLYRHNLNRLDIFTNGAARWYVDSTGNLIAAAAGQGIDFGATSDGSGSGQAEILDDFETGSWSPQFYSSGGTLTATMDVRSARYVKVGHMVTVMCYIRTSNVDNSSASGTLRISGLPFGVAGSNNYTAVSVGHALNWSTAPAGGYTESGASNIILDKRASIGGDLSPMAPSDLTNGSGTNNEVMLTATYCSF